MRLTPARRQLVAASCVTSSGLASNVTSTSSRKGVAERREKRGQGVRRQQRRCAAAEVDGLQAILGIPGQAPGVSYPRSEIPGLAPGVSGPDRVSHRRSEIPGLAPGVSQPLSQLLNNCIHVLPRRDALAHGDREVAVRAAAPAEGDVEINVTHAEKDN